MQIQHILAPTDYSVFSGRAIRVAGQLAKRMGAHLSVIHIPEDETPDQKKLEKFVAMWTRPEVQLEQVSAIGSAAQAVAEWCAEFKVDMVVCGSHGKTGWGRVLLGSFSEKLIQLGPCPVFVLRSQADDLAPDQIFLATDLSPASESARHWAVQLAVLFGVPLALLHVLPQAALRVEESLRLEKEQRAAQERAEALVLEGLGECIPIQPHILIGRPASQICAQAEGREQALIVTGTSSERQTRGFLGSVALEVCTSAPCSVLVVPSGS